MKDSVLKNFMSGVVPPIALLLILLATVVPFAMHTSPWAMAAFPWVYATGAALLLISSFFTRRPADDMRLRRLRRTDAMAALIFAVGAYFLFAHGFGWGRDWIAFTLAGAAVKLFTTVAIPRAERRLEESKK